MERTDAAVIEHGHLGQVVGNLARYLGSLCPRRAAQEKGRGEQHAQGQTGEAAQACAAGAKHPSPTDEQEQIACVGNADAVGVGGYEENGALLVGIVGRLAEAIAALAADMVHRDGERIGAARLLGQEARTIIHGGVGAGIAEGFVVQEAHAEGQAIGAPVFEGEGAGGLAYAQMERPLASEKMGDERAQEDDDKRAVEEEHRRTLLNLAAKKNDHGQQTERGPQADEPPRTVDVRGRESLSVGFL